MFTFLVILSVVTLASFDQVDNAVDKLPLFMRTESVRHVVELFYSMPSSERKVISTAADRFARDHHKPTFYAQLMDTNLKLFEAMDVAVTRFTDRIAYIKESISNQFAMEMTVVMECAFHEVFRKSNMKPIDSLMLQWAKQFLKLPVDAQKGFEGEFPCLANELRGSAFGRSAGTNWAGINHDKEAERNTWKGSAIGRSSGRNWADINHDKEESNSWKGLPMGRARIAQTKSADTDHDTAGKGDDKNGEARSGDLAPAPNFLRAPSKLRTRRRRRSYDYWWMRKDSKKNETLESTKFARQTSTEPTAQQRNATTAPADLSIISYFHARAISPLFSSSDVYGTNSTTAKCHNSPCRFVHHLLFSCESDLPSIQLVRRQRNQQHNSEMPQQHLVNENGRIPHHLPFPCNGTDGPSLRIGERRRRSQQYENAQALPNPVRVKIEVFQNLEGEAGSVRKVRAV
ncbi:unnamed protein product [Nippostrongylus brasiliensis]|uniref:Uncharacterized protein n=1 Tax=Nippostrongylus brasiliensis TaxID=27835 RepID=A0A158QXP8_NIPBR|nr:unnamed protein product [Nippostrongylus brasiliensis]